MRTVNVIRLVSICPCKGERFTFFRKAFGLVTCPLLFFTLPRSLGRPAYYSSPLDLVFFSSEDCECHTACIYMSLQGWQAHVLRQALCLSSAHCASSEGCACDRASYMSLQEWQADVLRQAFGLSSAHCASSAAVNVTGPVSICR